MKKWLLCLCLVLSLCVFANGEASQKAKFFSEPRTFGKLNNNQAADGEFPNIFRTVVVVFKKIFGIKRKPVYCPPPASVTNLNLNKTEVFSTCATDGKSCSGNIQTIDVFTEAFDPEDDLLTYNYVVTGGKIVGTGAKVVWNLSGVKPGTYTITAGVDDGCGVCGKTETKEIKVLECPNCN
ncbi:MAG TPA: hypothetical protein VF599_05275 [Pyrinomonadaceae bacterium]|jgi:hypothetical protein